MEPARKLLHSSAQRIAVAAAEMQAADELVCVLERTVKSAAAAMAGDGGFVPSELAAILDESSLGKMLRAIMGESIECFRSELPDHECAQSVLALRAALHGAIPRPPAESADREFFRRLLESDSADLEDDHSRMFGLFQDLALNLGDIMYVHDLNGTILYINDSGLEATQFTVQDVLDGLSIYDMVVPEFVDIIDARLEAPGAVSRSPYTCEIYTKEGDRIAVEITSRCMMRNRQITGIIGIVRDLRLARRLETEITRLNACMDGLLEGLPAGVLFTDVRGVIQDANPAATNLFGAPNAAALSGMPLAVALREERPGLNRILTAAMKGGREGRFHYSGTTHFGADIDWEVTAIPVSPHDGQKLFLILISDIAAERSEDTQAHTEKLTALGEIVGGIAHELNNPLTGILGYAQLLLNSELEPAIRSRVQHVAKEAERCRALVQNLFTFAQSDNSRKVPSDINAIVSNVLSLREYQFHVDGVSVDVALAAELPEVMANAGDLQRVFLSFLMNAQQALKGVVKESKQICVKTCADDSSVCIEFVDNGPGIPKYIQHKIFDPFFTTKGVGGGAGLGLSMAYGLIRDHGGTVALESDGKSGTVFKITLPSVGS